jgi:hypothetical protein
MNPLLANPWVLIVGAAILAVASFGYGYYVANDQIQDNLIAAQGTARATQKKFDDEAAAHAATLSKLVAERRKVKIQIIERVRTDIMELPMVVNGACEITPDALRLLNEAAQ